MTKRILVAIDGSLPAERALEIGADLAAQRSAELVILSVRENKALPEDVRRMAEVEHVADAAPVPAPPSIANVPSWMADGMNAAALAEEDYLIVKRLTDMATAFGAEAARTRGAAVRTRIEDGDAAMKILAVAREEACDLLVVGSRGLGNLTRMVGGSVSAKVTAEAPCPCITVT